MADVIGQRTVDGFLAMASAALTAAHINSARLDSELLLVHVLAQPREYLLAHGDKAISKPDWQALCLLLARRVAREPLAYLVGSKAFYGRNFIVTPDVLVPRPESEQLIDELDRILAKQHPTDATTSQATTLADVGTGSGCLAITAQLEHPGLSVIASDVSPAALAVAQQNAHQLGANVQFIQSDLLAQYPIGQPLDIIMANLPYLDQAWHDSAISPELASEPAAALYAADHGSDLIQKLLFAAPPYLKAGGHIVLELDPRQVDAIINFAKQRNYHVITQKPFLLTLQLN